MRKFKLVLGYLLIASPVIALLIYALITGKLMRFLFAIGIVALPFITIIVGVTLIQNNQ